MNWLKKIAQPMPTMAPTPQAASIEQQLIGLVDSILLNDGTDLIFVKQQLQQAKTQGVNLEAVCSHINESAAGVNPAAPDSSAYKKMMELAEAGGCYWEPTNPPMSQQPDNNMMDPSMMPNYMGQQEQPMEMPSAEIGN